MLVPRNLSGVGFILAREYLRGKYCCTVDLLFDWFGISCMTTNNFVFICKTGQAGGQRYSDIFPFSIPCFSY
jgi:hypothetical protein